MISSPFFLPPSLPFPNSPSVPLFVAGPFLFYHFYSIGEGGGKGAAEMFQTFGVTESSLADCAVFGATPRSPVAGCILFDFLVHLGKARAQPLPGPFCYFLTRIFLTPRAWCMHITLHVGIWLRYATPKGPRRWVRRSPAWTIFSPHPFPQANPFLFLYLRCASHIFVRPILLFTQEKKKTKKKKQSCG